MDVPKPQIDVAVAVLQRPDGAVLLGSRPEGKPYAGYWEFPGGRIESGETVSQALRRELIEELNLEVVGDYHWCVFVHDYPHAVVRLFFRRAIGAFNNPVPQENQQAAFFLPGQDTPGPLLPASIKPRSWLELPAELNPNALPAGFRGLCLNGLELHSDLLFVDSIDYYWVTHDVARWRAHLENANQRPCYFIE